MLDKKWLAKYQNRYHRGQNRRHASFLIALNVLSQFSAQDRIIVETGTQRLLDDLGAGESTSIFGSFCQSMGGTLYTVDNSEKHLNISKEATEAYSKNIRYIHKKSTDFLVDFDKNIDLLYLDSLDCEPEPQRLEAIRYNFMEIMYAYEQLSPYAVVLLDDYDNFGDKAKCKKTYDLLSKLDGWINLYSDQQAVFWRYNPKVSVKSITG